MLRRYLPIFVFVVLVGLLRWGVVHTVVPESEDSNRQASAEGAASGELQQSRRRLLLETLDRAVSHQRYYHSIYGRYTKLLSRVGVSIPRDLSGIYDIQVMEATKDHLLISAFSEMEGRIADVVSIDQDSEIKANFALPLPSAQYVRYRALKHLRDLRLAPDNQLLGEQTLFKGYFRYEVRRDSRDQKVAFAVGVKPPVVGMQLEDSGSSLLVTAMDAETEAVTEQMGDESGSLHAGQKDTRNVTDTLEEVYLAQKIFHGEVGRYAKNWKELSKITGFEFPKESQGQGAGRLLSWVGSAENPAQEEAVIEIDASRAPAATSGDLDIEPVTDSDTQ